MYIFKKIKIYFKKCFNSHHVDTNINKLDIKEDLLHQTEDIFLNNVQTTYTNNKYKQGKSHKKKKNLHNNFSHNYYNCFESYEEMMKK